MDDLDTKDARTSTYSGMKCTPPPVFVTYMRYKVDLTKIAPPPGRLGRLRRTLALWLWPQLCQQQEAEGVMEYTPVRGTD